MKPERLFLSPPHLTGAELPLVQEAFASNWIAPVGPHIEAFEGEFCKATGARNAAALGTGTAALHLALRIAGIKRGDSVYCSTLTFAASINPAIVEGASPVFIDSEERSWNMDPALLAAELEVDAKKGRLPRAVILVHIYGQSADTDAIRAACERHGVTLIEDAAEALGATYKGAQPGARGRFGVFSFNGNKIITTSNGGMLCSDDPAVTTQARFLATQARDPAPHYQHSQIGFNYRMSNILAAVGRGQLQTLGERVARRRAIFDQYRAAFEGRPGITMMPEAPWGKANRWLSVILIDPEAFGASREDIRLRLEARNIESRPVWKPMHLQPVFEGCRSVGGKVSERLFERGLCLPSGTGMTKEDVARVVEGVLG